MNARRLKFVEGVLAGKTAKQAYLDAGYSPAATRPKPGLNRY
jgi:hypothetical protein